MRHRKLRWITADGTVLLTNGDRAVQERDARRDRLRRLGSDPEGFDPDVQT